MKAKPEKYVKKRTVKADERKTKQKNTDGAQRNRNTSLFEELLRESSAETEAKAGSGQTDDGSIFENTADNTKTENYSNTLTDDYENGTSFTNDETIDSYIKIPQRKNHIVCRSSSVCGSSR